jgi:hypothetical protein
VSVGVAQLMKPTGPVGERFLNDKRLITGIMGPVGSAKTTKCVAKMVKSALWQEPGPDGIYRAKWGVIRDTYPQLKKTVLATWFRWFPKTLGDWNGEAPYEHTLRFLVIHGGRKCEVELTVIFAAIGENKAEDVMRGWEVTGIWLNEGDLVSHEVFAYAMTRIGRFPANCTWRGLILDMNAPDIENWTYTVFVEQDLGITDELAAELRAELGELFGIGFHVQPGGRSKIRRPRTSKICRRATTRSKFSRCRKCPGWFAAWSTMSSARCGTGNPFSPSITTISIARRRSSSRSPASGSGSRPTPAARRRP